MISYRFKRRAFLTAVGGGVGLKVMFRNMEASAQTATSPPRFLLTHWPVGIVAGSGDALWTPPAGKAAGGYGLQTFVDNGLDNDMITIRGISTNALPLNGGGSHEGGTVVLVTGVGCPATRTNRGEGDDGYAGGPSIDQVLLKNVPGLKSPMGGAGYANSICDSRTDLGEVSTKCLSYSYNTQSVTKYNNGGTGTENIPLVPTLSPLTQYTNLFSNFAYDGSGDTGTTNAAAPTADAMLTKLASKRSVLDFAMAEITALNGMIPSDAKNKLQNHFDALQSMESALTSNINTAYPTVTGTGGATGRAGAGGSTGKGGSGGSTGAGGTGGQVGCAKPMAPPNTSGAADYSSGSHGNYSSPTAGSTDDMALHQQVGKLHMDILRAAFVCDIVRVGSFQWSPGTNHVGFKGMYPGDNNSIYQHHPVSHRISTGATTQGTTPDGITDNNARFLYNIQTWYWARTAENLAAWKSSVDAFGNSLLDYTIIPFVTEVAATGHERTNMPCMIFGGKKLGMQLGQYVKGSYSVNQYFGTIAQAFGYSSTASPLAAPIAGLWKAP